MISKIEYISLPPVVYIEYHPDENLFEDTRHIMQQVAFTSMAVRDKEPCEDKLAFLMYRLLVTGYLCILSDVQDTVIIQTVLNDELETTIEGVDNEIADMVNGKTPLSKIMLEGLRKFIS